MWRLCGLEEVLMLEPTAVDNECTFTSVDLDLKMCRRFCDDDSRGNQSDIKLWLCFSDHI